jgi:hypothetical protein
MADDKQAVRPAFGEKSRDAEFLHSEFGVRPDQAASLSTDNKGEAEAVEATVRQANKGSGALPGATSPEASSVEAASDMNEDYNKPLIQDNNNHSGAG